MSWSELITPLPLGTYGDLRIDPNLGVYLGSVQCDASGDGQLPYLLPADIGLVGLRLYLQAVGSSTTIGLRLGTHQSFIIR